MTIDQLVGMAQRIHDAERWNLGAASTRETRNAFWARVVGCAHHGHPAYNSTPDPQWHLKSGGNGRPQSDDVAVSMPSRAFWDCIGGVGADGYRFGANGHAETLPLEQPVFPPPVPNGGGVSTPPATSEYWTPAHDTIRTRMAGRSAQEVAEQLAYRFPAEGWGIKRTSGGTWSADTIGRLVDGRLWAIKLSPVTIYGFLDASHVHRAVSPVNHLGDAVTPPPVEPPPPPPPPPQAPDVEAIARALGEVRDGLTALAANISALDDKVTAQRQEVIDAVKGQSYAINANVAGIGKIRGDITPKS